MTQAPEVQCPKCGEVFYLDADFEYELDSQCDCPKCDALLTCTQEEAVRYWKWDVVEETEETKK